MPHQTNDWREELDSITEIITSIRYVERKLIDEIIIEMLASHTHKIKEDIRNKLLDLNPLLPHTKIDHWTGENAVGYTEATSDMLKLLEEN